jgi:molybdate transport system substrate-binding protein
MQVFNWTDRLWHGRKPNSTEENAMTVLRRLAATLATCISVAVGGWAAIAADITVLSSRNVQPEMDAVIPAFERATGHKVSISYATTPEFLKRVDQIAQMDMAILFTETMNRFVQTSKIAVSARFDILQSGIGAVVRAGAPKPDISSVPALKSALLGAKSVAFSQGPTGVYMSTVVRRLGIADQLKPKTILTDSGIGAVGKAVAAGEAEIGIHGTYELLSVAGIDFVGPIPSELQRMMVYSTIIPAAAKEPQTAKALAKFLSSDIAIPLIRQHGMEPIAVH